MTADFRPLNVSVTLIVQTRLLDCVKYRREARALIAVCGRRVSLMSGQTCSYGI